MIRPKRYTDEARSGRRSRAVNGVTDVKDERPILIAITEADEIVDVRALPVVSYRATLLKPLHLFP